MTGGNQSTATLEFGNVRVGASSTRNFAVNNTGATGPALRGALQTDNSAGNGGNVTDARLTGAGVTDQNFGPTLAGSSSEEFEVTFNADAAGSLTGQQVAIVNNFDNVDSQVLSFSGSAFNAAVAEITPTTAVDFGIVHVGDVLPPTIISVGNTALPGTFSEDLRAENFTATGGVELDGGGPGSVTLVAGASTNAAAVLFDTSSAGVRSGSVSIDLVSTGDVNGVSIADLDELSLGTETIQLSGTVNNFANAEITQISGDGVLSATLPNEFLLDFGTVVQGDFDLQAELGLLNDISGPADTLTGEFQLLSSSFSLSGFDLVGDIAAGETQDGFLIGLGTETTGLFSTSILFDPLSENGSGFSGGLDQITINVRANVTAVPEPNSMGVILLASIATTMIRRRRN